MFEDNEDVIRRRKSKEPTENGIIFPSNHCRLNRLPKTAVLSDSVESFRDAITSTNPSILPSICTYF